MLFNCDQVVDALGLACEPRGDQIFDIHKAFAELLRVVLYVLIHLERLKYGRHLLLGQRFIDELVEQLAELVKSDSIARLNDLACEQLPLLLRHFLRDLVE